MSATDNLQDAVKAFTREWLITRLLEHGGSRRETADAIGMNPSYLRKLARDHGIGPKDGVGRGKPGARPGQAQHCGWCHAPGHNRARCAARGAA